MSWLLPAVIVAQLADLGTTAAGLSRGCHEAVYPIHQPLALMSVKGGGLVVYTLTWPRVSRVHPTLATWSAVGLFGSGLVGATLNMRTLAQGCHR